ncbi:ABC transporter permease [Corallincola spongiicola]|uniref:ABC transporter permease n=1 Tax=Corallincola spongiicola TaxID=2520508 RepID=A0ABY1WNT1_9GAMM|nr:FtsX-like permease family protein [Corallincola spongiicola]TAA45209.1 ABC transporter permease [Corallincola spongiicola]
MFLSLCWKSLYSRKGSVLLTVLALTVSILVLLGVEHIRQQSKESFRQTVSGVDLIVGARTSSTNLLLYSVFRMGNATNNIDWSTYQKITELPDIAWTIPISLGDSHKGYRVMGTTTDYFTHFRYGQQQSLSFSAGDGFSDLFDVVLGADVARKLNYQLGDSLILSHGLVSTQFSSHDDKPFTVVGILAPTGTPVDQALHVSLAGIEAIHLNWQQGVKLPVTASPAPLIDPNQLVPQSITAMMVGLNSKISTFRVQRAINQYRGEALTAILPGVALSELWQMMAVMENTLRLISVLILVASLLGLSAMMLASIRERQREIQVMRLIGASPWFLFRLIQVEALIIVLLSMALAGGVLSASLLVLNGYLSTEYSLHISANFISQSSLTMMAAVIAATVLVSTIPAVSAYHRGIKSAGQ